MGYEKPELEVIDCGQDVIVTSGGTGTGIPDNDVKG